MKRLVITKSTPRYSYKILKHDSGIIELALNLADKNDSSDSFNDTTYLISGSGADEIVGIFEMTEVFERGIKYSKSHSHNKEERIWYWIPISLLGHRELQNKLLK